MRTRKPPAYRRAIIHGNVRAVVQLYDAATKRRRTYNLGRYGSQESRERYRRILADFDAAGGRLPGSTAFLRDPNGPTVAQIGYEFWRAHRDIYSRSHVLNIESVIRELRAMYGSEAAAAFGPKALRTLRAAMVKKGWTRKYVNDQITIVRQIFRWAVSHELLPVTVYDALRTVEPLLLGRTTAPEGAPVRPVPDDALAATLPHLGRQVRAVVELQLLTGARAGEILALRRRDIVTDDVPQMWVANIERHKTAHHGKSRTLYFGARAQAVIKPFMDRLPDAYLFNPAEAAQEWLAAHNRSMPPPDGVRRPRDHYTTDTYRRAIVRACDRAFPLPDGLAKREDESYRKYSKRLTADDRERITAWRKSHRWHPHQLRHNAATALRREFGLEAAQLILGHSSAQITDAVYADRDREKIIGIIQKIG